jgi:hypothetical protein
MEVFTPDEIRRLIDAQEEPLRTLLLTAALTGMRQGELWASVGGHRLRETPDSRPAVALARHARDAQLQALTARDRYAANARAGPSEGIVYTAV